MQKPLRNKSYSIFILKIYISLAQSMIKKEKPSKNHIFDQFSLNWS